ncbi:hypothetical protein [Vannielia litorea]|uniref:Excalibur calcium-binding domain-containing protein n=1 Tax=Vannielia litorea TaxID=1217970 RepID=A0A1N6EFP7_9RHOB|nr:hypothetical protein [Vannielia litorea]SIN81849.1 hypothetical protein SAMN05444002_0721 [Vannielia litorea]
MRAWLPLCAVAALAACSPTVPDSGSGVGFGDYDSYQSQLRRDTALATSQRQTVQAPATAVASSDSYPSAEAPAATGAPTAAEIDAALGRTPSPQTQPVITPAAPIQTAAITPAPTAARSSGSGAAISDEQSFSAVSSRESIASDAERMRQNRAQFEQAPVTALPSRPEDTGPNLAQYALSTTNLPGQQIYRRGFTTQRKYDRACAAQPSAALAQQAFLAAGGPEKDRLGMDPDGDGFACGWDPRPFRAAKG